MNDYHLQLKYERNIRWKGGEHMQISSKSGLALFLIGCGALILLNKMGIHVSGLMSFLIPILLIVLGWVGLRNNKKIIGIILIGVGMLGLIGKLAGVIGFLFAAGLIVYGVYMLKNKREAC